ncbi:two pore domain potassium channel family protein [Azospirillum sp. Vi22]|uniref:potassium channel family protein n=1 Tax=Azospirillum baldaniorum TaxID=1064539 RepID=UPI00157AF8AF|nr:potassium channel family protein [Azospirillum baldaniorum]NUB09439.1 two pore domain potassium channel family protein [Azospirillum baldaniorum]
MNVVSSGIAMAFWSGPIAASQNFSLLFGAIVPGIIFSFLNMNRTFFIYGLIYRIVYVGVGIIGGCLIGAVLETHHSGMFFWAFFLFFLIMISWVVAIIMVHHNGLCIRPNQTRDFAQRYLRLFNTRYRTWIGRIIVFGLFGSAFIANYFHYDYSNSYVIEWGLVAFIAYFLTCSFGDQIIRVINWLNTEVFRRIADTIDEIGRMEEALAFQARRIKLCLMLLMLVVCGYASVYYAADNIAGGGGFSKCEKDESGEVICQKTSAADSLYFSVVTSATVGFGDISPRNDFMKLLVSTQILTSFWLITFVLQVIISGHGRDGGGSASASDGDLPRTGPMRFHVGQTLRNRFWARINRIS